MSKIKRIGTGRVAIATMAAVLAASGAAVAASDNSTSNAPKSGEAPGHHGPGGPGGPGGGPGGPDGKYLTYSETHTYKRGKETVIRTDAGKVTAVSDTSITVAERDGKSVTRELDSDTDFRVKDNSDATADDVKVGNTVMVGGEAGEPADVVGVRK
jgi:hypothetical protein